MTPQFANNQTINSLIDQSCAHFAALPALSFAFQKPYTYADLQQRFLLCAARLRARGIKPRDKVAILAENSPDWGVAYFAVIRLGAIVVPILPDFPEADVHHILSDTRAKLLFTTERQLDKIYELKIHFLKTVVTLDDYSSSFEAVKIEPLSEFLTGTTAGDESYGSDIEDRTRNGEIASIIYTSGTSGHSKAVMLSHANLCANVKSARSVCSNNQYAKSCGAIDTDWTFLSVLPMSHTYEFTTSFLLPLSCGSRVVYCDKPPTPVILQKICAQEKPTAICVVPMIMEKIYKKRIMPALQSKVIVRLAMKVPMLRARILKKAGAKLLDFFGGNLKLMAIGGAALNIEVEKFLFEAGFPYMVGYGLTETSPLLCAGPFGDPTIEVGSCGKVVPDVALRIADPDPVSGIGEIMAKGPNVMLGYFNNQLATTETIDGEGWLGTGDLGCFDESKNLVITGRSKSVIVLSNGENIYPETIEEKINSHIEVAESLVVESGDKLMAIICPDYEYIDSVTKGKSEQQKLEYIGQFMHDIQRSVNAVLPPYAKIAKVVERQEPFTKTATHKIKRYLFASNN